MTPLEAGLVRYLESHLQRASSVAITNLSRIPGGASRETWMFDASWEEHGKALTAPFVLRKDPPASLVESERAVEYAFYSAFERSSVPVPHMRWLEEDPSHLGSPFFIMDRINGSETNTRRILEPDLDPSRDFIARRMYEILAAISTFDWEGSAISRVMKPPPLEECWKHELDYWEGMIDANELSPQPIARAAIRWLRANPPPPPKRVSVVHGDYRVGNFLYNTEGIHGVLDWEMAHLGDPIEDLAWSFMELWEAGQPRRKGGIIDEDAAVRIFEGASGLKVDRDALHWWDVFSGVKAQGIWLTGARSLNDGRTGELILIYTSYALINLQDEILLRSLGKGA